MSVDTYLKGKNTSRYRRVEQDELEIFVAPALINQAARLTVDAGRFLFWRSFSVAAEPRHSHFHGPTCTH